MRLRAQRATDRVAQVDDRHDAVRVPVCAGGSREHADELVDAGGQADLFRDLAHDRVLGFLVAVDPTRNESPRLVVGAAHEQDPIVLVEEGGIDADLGRDVPKLPREARPDLGDFEAGPVGVLARREREQMLVALAIEWIGRVMKAGLRNGADLVEQRDDVDANDATCRSTGARRLALGIHRAPSRGAGA
jgi:hypothetical protein